MVRAKYRIIDSAPYIPCYGVKPDGKIGKYPVRKRTRYKLVETHETHDKTGQLGRNRPTGDKLQECSMPCSTPCDKCASRCDTLKRLKRVAEYKKRRDREYQRWCKFNASKFKQRSRKWYVT